MGRRYNKDGREEKKVKVRWWGEGSDRLIPQAALAISDSFAGPGSTTLYKICLVLQFGSILHCFARKCTAIIHSIITWPITGADSFSCNSEAHTCLMQIGTRVPDEMIAKDTLGIPFHNSNENAQEDSWGLQARR
jgi:hypothetical protein